MAIKRPEWEIRRCPYCFEKLGYFEYKKRKCRKICICKKCKKIIDERNMIW